MDVKKVLIVDDEREFAEALAERLQLRGVSAQVALDGLGALRAVDGDPPDAVLLDLMMPEMNGFEVLRCLKEHWPGLPVIIVTGHGNEDAAGECLRQGAFRFMAKPVDFEKLIEAFKAIEKPGEAKETAKAGQTEPRPRVLVVDDEERYRANMVKLLWIEGFSAQPAATGEEALAILAGEHFDAVLLDIRMPGLSGVGTLKRIRETGCQAEVIVITGHAALDQARELLDLGAYDYLLKPVRTELVCAKIREAISTGQMCRARECRIK
jgi:DNA-binding NtrC family response regulator